MRLAISETVHPRNSFGTRMAEFSSSSSSRNLFGIPGSLPPASPSSIAVAFSGPAPFGGDAPSRIGAVGQWRTPERRRLSLIIKVQSRRFLPSIKIPLTDVPTIFFAQERTAQSRPLLRRLRVDLVCLLIACSRYRPRRTKNAVIPADLVVRLGSLSLCAALGRSRPEGLCSPSVDHK